MHIFLALAAPLALALSAWSLNVEIHTMKNLGHCLNAPVFVGDFMAVRSCSEKQVAFINLNNYEDIQGVEMEFEPSITEVRLGADTYHYVELDDEILLLYHPTTLKVTVISSGKMQKSPRSSPPSADFDDIEISFSYENYSVWVRVYDKKTKQYSSQTLVGQRSIMAKNVIDGFEYTIASSIIKARNISTQETFTIASGSVPSPITRVNERYLINANWGDNTVSFIDKSNHTIALTIKVGKYPLRPVTYRNKIYISNYGDGSISILELKDQI